MSVTARRGRSGVLVLLILALAGSCIIALCVGAVTIPLGDVAGILLGKLQGAATENFQHERVLWYLRVPRILLGVLVGAALSVAGALMQGLFRNPLADPGLIGVSSGAALGAVLVIILGAIVWPEVAWLHDMRLLPASAFLGALIVTLIIQRLADTSGYTAVATLLLAGIAVNALVGSVIGVSTFLATDAQLRTLTFWTLGSLGSASWDTVILAAPFCLILIFIAPFFASILNALALGEAEAGHLGFSVQKMKTLLIFVTAFGVGACVAFTGMIGFIGLVVPHVIRLWIGPDHRWLLPSSAILGAALLVSADTVARTIASPAEIPIGVLTAAFGAPFFLFMLLRQRGRALWG